MWRNKNLSEQHDFFLHFPPEKILNVVIRMPIFVKKIFNSLRLHIYNFLRKRIHSVIVAIFFTQVFATQRTISRRRRCRRRIDIVCLGVSRRLRFFFIKRVVGFNLGGGGAMISVGQVSPPILLFLLVCVISRVNAIIWPVDNRLLLFSNVLVLKDSILVFGTVQILIRSISMTCLFSASIGSLESFLREMDIRLGRRQKSGSVGWCAPQTCNKNFLFW